MNSLIECVGIGLAFLALCFAFTGIVALTQRKGEGEGNDGN